MKHLAKFAVTLSASSLLLALSQPAHADIPAGYLGTPFNPATLGGAGIIPASVKAGPFAVPGRIDLVNYDGGGDGVGFHSEAHYTTKNGDGYRTDRPTATMCKTATSKPDVWYDTGSATDDGKAYPADAAEDFYIGSVHPNDWFNYTVNVKTAGMYTVSANFATGNGPPGGEGGDGQMELIISVNGTKQADWKAIFPDFQNKADFHHWKAYPKLAMLTLTAGVQVIKIELPFKHLNLDYLQLDLVGGDPVGGGGAGGAGGGSGTGGAAGSSGNAGTAATAGNGGTLANGGSGGAPASTAGSTSSGGTVAGETSTGNSAGSGGSTLTNAGSTGQAGSTPVTTTAASSGDSSGCAFALSKRGGNSGLTLFGAAALGLGLAARRRRRQ